MRTGTGVPTELGWHGSRARAERLLMFDMAGALTPVGEARVARRSVRICRDRFVPRTRG